MATSSISGLVSGLDTASIIDQLMQLETVPQNKLKDQKTNETSVMAALRALNTDTSVIASSAATLAKPETWQTLKATATGTGVSVSATAAAAAGSFSFTVDKLAVTHKLGFTAAAALTDVVAGATVKLTTHDGVAHSIATGTGSLKDLVAGINAATKDTGVTAVAVKVADGSYRLITESTATGVASSFTLTKADGSDVLGGATVRAGDDAQISMGLGITATSSSNTFTDLTPGVSVTLADAATVGSNVTVKVAQDPSAVKNSISALVASVNKMLTNIDTQTAGKTATTTAGVLAGNATARSLRNELLETVFGNGTTSMAAYGLQTDRYGKLVFDDAKFATAYAADPAGVAAKFTTGATTAGNGWAARVATVAGSASNATTGTLTTAIAGRNSDIDSLSKSIAAWDDRLELRRQSLQQTYTALETALSSMQSQGTWLASQIASLPKMSS